MMKKLVTIITVMFLLVAFTVPISAQDMSTQYSDTYNDFKADKLEEALSDEVLNVLREFEISPDNPDSVSDFGISKLFGDLLDTVLSDYKAPLSTFVVLLIAAVFSFINKSVLPSKVGANESGQFLIASVCAIIIMLPLSNLATEVSESIKSCTVYMHAFIPVFASILAAGGFTAMSGTYSSIMFGAAQIFESVNSTVFVPACNILLGASVCTSLSKSPFSIAEASKKLIVSCFSILLTVFTAIMGLQSKLSTATDSVIIKTAKSAISTFVPIVGSTLSDSISIVIGSIDLLKSTLGVFTVIVLCIIFLPALLKLLIWKLVISVTQSLFEISENGVVIQMTKAIGSIITIIISIVICAALLMIISVFTVISMGNSL